MTTRARMGSTLLGCFACFWWATPYAGLFLFGMWLADRRHQRTRLQRKDAIVLPLAAQPTLAESSSMKPVTVEEKDAVPTLDSRTLEDGTSAPRVISTPRGVHKSSSSTESTELTLRQQLPYIVLFTLSLWPMVAPEPIQDTKSLPYPWIAQTAPPAWNNSPGLSHWSYSIGAIMMCYALEHSPLLQAPLRAPVSQFIGELSFGIYIMHMLVRWMVWESWFRQWQSVHFGKGRIHQVPGYLLMTVLVFWAAEIFRRVDVKCVRLTKRLQDMLWEH